MHNVKEKKSVKYLSSQGELEEWIRDFSLYLKTHPEENKNTIIYPKEFATGFAKIYTIEPGLTYRIVDYQLNADFISTRETSGEFFLIIYFYQYSNCSGLVFKINNQKIIDTNESDYSTMIMMNSYQNQCVEIKKGTYARGLTVQVSEKWLRDKISHQDTFNHNFFKHTEIFQSFLTPKSQKLLTEIFTQNKSFVPSLYLNNRVTRLLEAFFDNFLKKGVENKYPSLIDAGKLLRVKSYLLENYDNGFPQIDYLARIALMSTSKLKKDFKKSFNMGMYEYYQKNRMHVAKELLSSEKYSVSEVGNKVGYKNMSNFASAFKREFSHLPKDFKKIQ